MPRVTVVIPTRDRPDFLAELLDALDIAIRGDDEIIVVDSASVSDEVQHVARAAGARLLRLDEPGASHARNAGWIAARSAVVAFLDDDCIPRPGWANALARRFSDPDVAFVTGRVVALEDGRPAVSVHDGALPRQFRRGCDPATLGHAANLAVRRSTLEQVGGFDEGLGPATSFRAAEDHDLLWRILATGSSGVYEPAALVAHRQWRTRRDVVRLRYGYGLGSGAVAAKIARLDPDEGRALTRAWFWTRGLTQVPRDLFAGYEIGAASGLARAAGFVVGRLKGRRRALTDGLYAPAK